MSQQEILELFRTQAQHLHRSYHRLDDIVLMLANSIASSSACLKKEDFDALVYIGSVLEKEGAKRSRARVEVAQTMQASHDAQHLLRNG